MSDKRFTVAGVVFNDHVKPVVKPKRTRRAAAPKPAAVDIYVDEAGATEENASSEIV